MSGAVYVDESKRRDLVMVAGVVMPNDLAEARSQVRALYLHGQRSIHMVKESSGRQKQILAAICGMKVNVRIYVAEKRRHLTEVAARQHCLQAMLQDIAFEGQDRLILDRDDSLVVSDRQVIAAELHRLQYSGRLQYTHDKADHDPLLAVPDAIAWAWPQGGHWRDRCGSIITSICRS